MALTAQELQQVKDYGAIIITRLQPDIDSANINRGAATLEDVFVGAAPVTEADVLAELATVLAEVQADEQREQARLIDLGQITRDNYEQALSVIDSDLGDITSDLAALNDSPTNAQILQAIIRMAERQQAIAQRQRKLVRVASALVAESL